MLHEVCQARWFALKYPKMVFISWRANQRNIDALQRAF
jgi:hypothetical protein